MSTTHQIFLMLTRSLMGLDLETGMGYFRVEVMRVMIKSTRR
jgi:hypothetical protein